MSGKAYGHPETSDMQKLEKSIRPAWIETDLAQLRKNFELISRDLPEGVGFISVVKANAYGHGAAEVGKIALNFGATHLAVATIDEAIELRRCLPEAQIIVFGERTDEEFELSLEYDFACCIGSLERAKKISSLADEKDKRAVVHIKIDTGMSRYGVRWDKAAELVEYASKKKSLLLEGVMSHFTASDGQDKTFALKQLEKFKSVLDEMEKRNIRVKYRHMCNSGGFLDLPQAHFDLVRLGLLPLGVYPSQTCRRIPGIEPIMSVKCKIAAIREIETGDYVGYGMRYQAKSPRRIATLPLGYGDGYPRVHNQGEVLIHSRRVPIVGTNAMDAIMIDITGIPEAKLWDEAVLLGKQNGEEISVHEIAKLKESVSYDIFTGLNTRLPRVYIK